MQNKNKKSSAGIYFMGVGTGVILSSIIPGSVVIFVMAVLLLCMGFCLMRR